MPGSSDKDWLATKDGRWFRWHPEKITMPIHHGRTTKGIRASVGKNIAEERRLHVPRKQAIAIALSIARKDATKHHIKPAAVGARYRRRHR